MLDTIGPAARELGYVPNAQAQALARASTGLLGLVVHDIADPYFSSIAAGVMQEARAAGLLVALADTQRQPAQELAYVAAFRRDEALLLPHDLDYAALPGLSNEVKARLGEARPRSLGQAARLEGITPAALTILASQVRKSRRLATAE